MYDLEGLGVKAKKAAESLLAVPDKTLSRALECAARLMRENI